MSAKSIPDDYDEGEAFFIPKKNFLNEKKTLIQPR